MKIAVASDDGTAIAGHFGRTRGFVICEVEEGAVGKTEYRLNTFTGHALAAGVEDQPHHPHQHGPILQALGDCQVVISRGMGRRIHDDLIRTGISVFVTDTETVEEAVRAYLDGTLSHRPDFCCPDSFRHKE
jgi:predicted Fe-Mo cluster-binding NifX family protein